MHWSVFDYTQAARAYCWTREIDMNEEVEHEGRKMRRFEKVAYELMDLAVRMHFARQVEPR